MLLPGPDLLQKLVGNLSKFRKEAIAVKGDIEQMFLPVKLKKEGTQPLRCLYPDIKKSGQIKIYKCNIYKFGAKNYQLVQIMNYPSHWKFTIIQ